MLDRVASVCLPTVCFFCVVFTLTIGRGDEKQPQSKPRVSRPSVALPANVVAHKDVEYARRGERAMLMDVFVPKDIGEGATADGLPTVVVVHGGGWLKGDKSKFHAMAMELASRGFVTAAVGYRLGGEAKFPAAIHDCNDAVAFLRNHADKYRIDPARIGAVGGSAGGHLVGLMATASHIAALRSKDTSAEDCTIQAAIVLAGPWELATGPVAEKSRQNPQQSNANRWLGKTVDEDRKLYLLASPHTHISKNCPPVLFMTGELDSPHRNAASRAKLTKAGVATGINVYAEGKHGCWNKNPWFDIMVDDMDAFLSKTLKKSSPSAAKWIETPWGEIWRSSHQLTLLVKDTPFSHRVEFPRLHARIGDVHLKHDEEKKPLKFWPKVDTWEVTIPAGLSRNPVEIVVETKDRPRLGGVTPIVSQTTDGEIELHAYLAETNGELLRYEPQPHKNTVGYWANEKDWCQWRFYVERPGEFDLAILQGCGNDQGGSVVSVIVDGPDFSSALSYTVEDTGHFQNFRERSVGRIQIPKSGVYTLKIKPVSKAAKAIVDVRRVSLKPVDN